MVTGGGGLAGPDGSEFLRGKPMSRVRVMRRIFPKEMLVAGCLVSAPMAFMWAWAYWGSLTSADSLWLTIMTVFFVLTLDASVKWPLGNLNAMQPASRDFRPRRIRLRSRPPRGR